VGRTVPLYCATSGRALLFGVQRDDLAALPADAGFGQLGPNAPRMFDELYERVEGSRTDGLAVVDEEFEPGLVGAAAPVRDFRGPGLRRDQPLRAQVPPRRARPDERGRQDHQDGS
jgi:IclR family KDG regulon transcriptional repressor